MFPGTFVPWNFRSLNVKELSEVPQIRPPADIAHFKYSFTYLHLLTVTASGSKVGRKNMLVAGNTNDENGWI